MAYHLKARQSPCGEKLKEQDTNLLSHHGSLVTDHVKDRSVFSKYLLADAYFSKKPFVDQVLQADIHLVSRLRDDADLKYLYQGPKSRVKADRKSTGEKRM